MFKNTVKSLSAFVAVMLFSVSSPATADDTEIYFASESGAGTYPQVMFYLEYTSNLTSTICTGMSDAMTDAEFAAACPTMAPFRMYMADNDLTASDTTIDQFEMTRAALKRVLAPIGGVKVGLIMPHDNDNNCAGPAETGCSGGGYILQKMVQLSKISGEVSTSVENDFSTATQSDLDAILAADTNKAALFTKLDALQSPQGNFSHKNQLKEVYFELFRYLTGQEVYNGHNGWNDYGTDSNYNLGDREAPVPANKNDYNCTSGTCTTQDTSNEYDYIPGSGTYMGDFVELPTGKYANTYRYKWDTTAEIDVDGDGYGENYLSPLIDCSKVFVINILDGGGTQQNDADSDIALSLANGGMNFSPSNNDPGFVQMVAWLHDKDLADGNITGYLEETGTTQALDLEEKQNVTSFFIANSTSQVDNAASAGGTGSAIALTDDPQDVVDTINDLFTDILSVSTTFVSASIPVNVFNRSEVLDNAYIALFQADADAQPTWVGNVKKLKLQIYQVCTTFDTDGTTCLEYQNKLRLIDANSASAISNIDGRILSGALTYWTDANGYDLFDNIDPDLEQAGYDGRAVHRGGSGQQIPNFLDSGGNQGNISLFGSSTGRTIYSEYSGSLVDLSYSSSYLAEFWPSIFDPSDTYLDSQWSSATDHASMTGVYSNDALKIYSTSECDTFVNSTSSSTVYGDGYNAGDGNCYVVDVYANIVAYIRGKDVADEDVDTIHDESRRWMFSDPLHSRPLPINYGARQGTPNGDYSETSPDVRILVGSNDGFLRMIRNTDGGGSESGEEVWAFMPRETLGIQKQLMENAANGTPIHPYGLDGPVTAYVQDGDGTITDETGGTDVDGDGVVDKVWIFFGMRRGGQHYYAMDVTDPDNPTFMWKIGPSTSGYSEMGYTFSQPVVRQLDWGADSGPVLIVGGGYDLDKDNNYPGTNDDTGNAIYVINAANGNLIWKASGSSSASASSTLPFVSINSDMDDSIPSEVTAVDATGDGKVDTIYVGDTGGRVWRADLYGDDPTAWQATMLLNLGRHSTTSTDVTVQKANDRRFFHAPDIVPARDNSGRYYAVIIGSGNRAHPLQNETTDGMFMYKDRLTGSALSSFTAITPSDLFDATDNCVQEVGVSCTSTNSAKLSEGWKLDFTTNGEKNLAAALTLRGVVYFSTYIPITSADSSSCVLKEGTGYQYAVALTDARAAINYDTTNTATDSSGEEHELQIEDRKRELLSGGIPSENVYVSYRDSAGNEYSGVLSSDLQAGEDLGKLQWRTYWLEKEK